MPFTTKKCLACHKYWSASPDETDIVLCPPCNQSRILRRKAKDGQLHETRPNVECTHKWVWSGIPNGSAWCKHCDVTYCPDQHGDIPDLSGEPRVNW